MGGKLLEDLGYLVINRESGKAIIDWEKTQAIGQRSGYIYINLKGRDPQGSVDPEDYDDLVQEIIDKIITYRDETGRRPFNLAFNRQDMASMGRLMSIGNSFTNLPFFQSPTSLNRHASIRTL